MTVGELVKLLEGLDPTDIVLFGFADLGKGGNSFSSPKEPVFRARAREATNGCFELPEIDDSDEDSAENYNAVVLDLEAAL